MQTKPPGETLTPEHIRHLGYTPIPVHPESRAIARRWIPGLDIDTPAGLQADGTYLHLLDLDSHTPGQDASAQLARIQKRVGPDLAARLAIRISRSGRGYHIVYRTATPHSEHACIKVFDPLQPDRHIGELIGPGQRVTLTGEWIQHGPDAIPLLSALELDQLKAAIHTPALYAPQDAPGSPQTAPGSHTRRKDRMAEGLSLIAGWEHVTDAKQRLEALAQRKQQVEQHLREMRRTPEDRSEAYSHLVQCLMFHAAGLGRDLYERCRVVAALAIHVGAAGKEHERTYKIVNDTATLIARILHGDAFLNNPDLHFGIQRWVNRPDIPARPSLTTHPQPAKRTPHPHAHDRQKNIKKLLRYLHKLPSREYDKHYTSLDDLAEHVKVSRRTVQDYLKELRERDAIRSGQDCGNGPLYIIIIEPPIPPKNPCRHAETLKAEPQTTTENQSNRDAEPAPELRTLAPDTPLADCVCTEVLGAPKPCAPVLLALADDQAASYELADDQAELAGASYEPAADDQAASYEPAGDQAACCEAIDDQTEVGGASYDPAADQIAAAAKVKPGRRRKSKDPIRKKLDDARQQLEDWRAMSLPELVNERRKLDLASQDCERSTKQRELFRAMVAGIDHEIGRKRSAGIHAMYQAANAATPQHASEPPAPVVGVMRRSWRSPVVWLSEYADPLPPYTPPPREHPIATLGTDPEAMRAAHEYCQAVLARGSEGT